MIFVRGRKTFLKKSFSSPNPHLSKKIKKGSVDCFCFVRSMDKSAMFALHPSWKVLVKLFQKLARVWGAKPHNTAFSFCKAFSLRLLCQRKSGIGLYVFGRSTQVAPTAYLFMFLLFVNNIKSYVFGPSRTPVPTTKVQCVTRPCHPERT